MDNFKYMKTKSCKKCGRKKSIYLFYKHRKMPDGFTNECIDCAKIRIKRSSRNIKRKCLICDKEFGTCASEIRRGGGKTCSRYCYYKRLAIIIKKCENSSN